MAWAANRGVLEMRTAMFAPAARRRAGPVHAHTASSLTNTLTFEVQNGANQLVYTLQSLVRDSLTLVAMLAVLLYLNWQLTLVVAVHAAGGGARHALLQPAPAPLHASRRRRRPTTSAYVVEENVLAWKSVRLHAAGPPQAERFARRQRPAAPGLAQGGDRLGDDDAAAPRCWRRARWRR